MAAGSPAELKQQGEELKSLFAKVKKKQHNCAILMSKEGIVVEAHIKKSPEVLLKAAKKAGGTPKGVWGTMTMEGQIIIVDPINDKIPGNLAKIAKKHFSERGMKFRLEIKEPEEESKSAPEGEEEEELQMATGQEDEEEIQMSSNEKEEEALQLNEGSSNEREETQTKTSETEDPKKKLEDKLKKIQPQIDELEADTENVMHSELVDALRGHERVMEEGNFDRAEDTIRRIEVALDDYASIQAKKLPLQKRFDDMASDLDRIDSGDDADAKEKIAIAKRGFEYALPKREWDDAERFLGTLDDVIKDAGNTQGDEQETEEMRNEPETEKQEETSENTTETSPPSDKENAKEESENPQLVELRDRYAAISDQIDALQKDTENVMHDQLVEAVRSYEMQIDEERYDRGFDSIARIESILEDYAGLLAKAKPLHDRMDKLQAGAERVKAGENDEAAREVSEAERGYIRAIRLREWDDATLHLDKIERHVTALGEENSESSDEEGTAPTTDETEARNENASEETEENSSENTKEDERIGDDDTTETTVSETTEENVEQPDNKAEKSKLVKRFAKSKDGLAKMLKAGDTMSGVDPRVLAVEFGKQMKSEEFTSAGTTLDEIEALIKEANNTPEKSARMERIAEMKKGLGSLLKELN